MEGLLEKIYRSYQGTISTFLFSTTPRPMGSGSTAASTSPAAVATTTDFPSSTNPHQVAQEEKKRKQMQITVTSINPNNRHFQINKKNCNLPQTARRLTSPAINSGGQGVLPRSQCLGNKHTLSLSPLLSSWLIYFVFSVWWLNIGRSVMLWIVVSCESTCGLFNVLTTCVLI